jgi:hypothetical protein
MKLNLSKALAGLCTLATATVWTAQAQAQLSAAEAAQLSQNVDQHVIVIMKSQHPAAPAGSSAAAARSASIAAEQAPLMDELRQVHAGNVKSYRLVNAFAATVSKDYATRLKANPAVAQVIPDEIVRLRTPASAMAGAIAEEEATPGWKGLAPNIIPGACGANGKALLDPEGLALTYTDSDQPYFPTARSLGVTGRGVKVAYIADGLDPNNINFIRPDGTSAFVDYQDFSGDGPVHPTTGAEAFIDANTIAGQGIQVYNVNGFSGQSYPSACNIRIEGVAPGAELVGLNAELTSGVITTSSILQAIEYAVQTDHVDVISESFTANLFPNIPALDVLQQFDEAAVAAGVVVTVGAGDSGPTNTIGVPATAPSVISVGGTTDFRYYAQTNQDAARYFATTGWLTDNIAPFSSGGFDQTGRTVDMVAPSDSSFASCEASPLFTDCLNLLGNPSNIEQSGGTSEACPFVAGASALIIEAYRKTHGGASPTPALVKQILLSTASDLGTPASEQGAGLLNSYQAVLLAESIHTADGSPKRLGNTLLLSTSQLNAVAAPGTPESWNVTVTNTGELPQIVKLSGRTLGSNQNVQTGDVALSDATSSKFTGWNNAPYNYSTFHFRVPANVDRLDASLAYPNTTATTGPVRLILIDARGRFAANSEPSGISGFGAAEVRFPVAGNWTGVIFSVVSTDGGVNGTIPWQVQTQQFVPFGSVQPDYLKLAPGQSETVKIFATTPSSPGDLAGSIALESDLGFAGTTSIPVTLRSLVDVAHGGKFSGVLTGGNGRPPGVGQVQYYEFNVPSGVQNITTNVSLTNDPANPVGAYLISPDGDTLGYGQNFLMTSGKSLTAYTLNPIPGTWTLIVVFASPIVGNEVSQPYTGNIQFNRVSVSAPGLPNSTSIKLAAGVPVTIPVTITNTGDAPAGYFFDARFDALEDITLPTQFGTPSAVPLPLAGGVPEWLVPTQTSSVTVSQSSSLPTMFDFSPAGGDPDLASSTSALCGTSESASYTSPGGSVAAGIWRAAPSECGPYPAPAPATTATLSLTAHTQPFDPTVTSETGDLWLQAINPNSPVTLLVINPGQTATVNVTITPAGTSGTVIKGTLYVDDGVRNISPYGLFSGNELAGFPYTYTIK